MRTIVLTAELVANVRKLPRFRALANALLASYETIVSNLQGYADILPMMRGYNSLWSLFRYSVSLAYEAHSIESSKQGSKAATLKYIQALAVLELILSEYRYANPEKAAIGDLLQCYYFVDNKGDKLFALEHPIIQGFTVQSVLKLQPLRPHELAYVKSLHAELLARCHTARQISQ